MFKKSIVDAIKSTKKINRVFITGANGQIGKELLPYMNEIYGPSNIMLSDLQAPHPSFAPLTKNNRWESLDVLDKQKFAKVLDDFKPDLLLHNAAILSAVAEKNTSLALDVNTIGLRNVLELSTERNLRLFIPSTVASFGPTTPRVKTPNVTIQRPKYLYGITKVFTELLGSYYSTKYNLDFRSLRYPPVISLAMPTSGSAVYSTEIFHAAVKEGKYKCYVRDSTKLAMIYMEDLIESTLVFLESDRKNLKEQTYNVQSCSFSVAEAVQEIRKHVKDFQISYELDFRQDIVDTWPIELDIDAAKKDWGWEPKWNLAAMTKDLLHNVRESVAQAQK